MRCCWYTTPADCCIWFPVWCGALLFHFNVGAVEEATPVPAGLVIGTKRFCLGPTIIGEFAAPGPGGDAPCTPIVGDENAGVAERELPSETER